MSFSSGYCPHEPPCDPTCGLSKGCCMQMDGNPYSSLGCPDGCAHDGPCDSKKHVVVDQRSPYEQAREAFDSYAGMDHPKLPTDPGAALQVMHFRWSQDKVKHKLFADVEGVLGVSEELGELTAAVGKLNHAVLNHYQERRGLEDTQKLREEVADGLADMCIFAMHLATAMRLDFWTIVRATATKVLKRDWKANPLDAHKDGT